ncbi:MAG: hypothetical protein ACTSX8_02730 [Alphaproteobacteria bacterium]
MAAENKNPFEAVLQDPRLQTLLIEFNLQAFTTCTPGGWSGMKFSYVIDPAASTSIGFEHRAIEINPKNVAKLLHAVHLLGVQVNEAREVFKGGSSNYNVWPYDLVSNIAKIFGIYWEGMDEECAARDRDGV